MNKKNEVQNEVSPRSLVPSRRRRRRRPSTRVRGDAAIRRVVALTRPRRRWRRNKLRLDPTGVGRRARNASALPAGFKGAGGKKPR